MSVSCRHQRPPPQGLRLLCAGAETELAWLHTLPAVGAAKFTHQEDRQPELQLVWTHGESPFQSVNSPASPGQQYALERTRPVAARAGRRVQEQACSRAQERQQRRQVPAH